MVVLCRHIRIDDQHYIKNKNNHLFLRYYDDNKNLRKNTKAPVDLAIWTGTDNLSMMVWTRDIHEFHEKYIKNVTGYLSLINYSDHYKRPIVTYNETLCHKGK
jgi:hypothetical protein